MIERGYWYRGTHGGDSGVAVLPGGRVIPGHEGLRGGCLTTADTLLVEPEVRDALARYLGLPNARLHTIWEANDSQPVETGREWAISVLREAADMVEREALEVGG